MWAPLQARSIILRRMDIVRDSYRTEQEAHSSRQVYRSVSYKTTRHVDTRFFVPRTRLIRDTYWIDGLATDWFDHRSTYQVGFAPYRTVGYLITCKVSVGRLLGYHSPIYFFEFVAAHRCAVLCTKLVAG